MNLSEDSRQQPFEKLAQRDGRLTYVNFLRSISPEQTGSSQQTYYHTYVNRHQFVPGHELQNRMQACKNQLLSVIESIAVLS